ncbi:hypothetical protein [Thermomonospora umbrina]|uniref:Uncharacterized protein n=1 Tax=Thermomonospora umbrina TaxID=111806 RepID=A0A3D9SWQ8_9ACTN|nr:hypothetical protein [Thermomonospora umbrina]REF00377.1 hypothetical protein DFJ69_5909 [Thermomonospora umbrina]
MPHFHLVAYGTATGETGVAHVLTDRTRPSWQECHEQIPGYRTGIDLGPAPTYTLRYDTEHGTQSRELTRPGIETVGRLVVRQADKDKVWNIAVLDANGGDITFDFPVFCG